MQLKSRYRIWQNWSWVDQEGRTQKKFLTVDKACKAIKSSCIPGFQKLKGEPLAALDSQQRGFSFLQQYPAAGHKEGCSKVWTCLDEGWEGRKRRQNCLYPGWKPRAARRESVADYTMPYPWLALYKKYQCNKLILWLCLQKSETQGERERKGFLVFKKVLFCFIACRLQGLMGCWSFCQYWQRWASKRVWWGLGSMPFGDRYIHTGISPHKSAWTKHEQTLTYKPDFWEI